MQDQAAGELVVCGQNRLWSNVRFAIEVIGTARVLSGFAILMNALILLVLFVK